MEHVEAHTMRLLGSASATEVKSSSVNVQPGDVLYGRLRPYLNKVYVAQTEALCSAEFIVFPGDREINPKWLSYLLNASEFMYFASHLPTGDRPRVDYDQIAGYPLLLPPKPEQQRIVDEIEKQLARLGAGVSALTRLQANLKRYSASVLRAACEGRLVPTEVEIARDEGRLYEPAGELLERILRDRRAQWEAAQLTRMISERNPPQDDSWKSKYKEPESPNANNLPALPEGWAWASSDQLFSFVTSGSRGWAKYYSEEGPLFLRMSNLDHDTILLDLSDRQCVQPPHGAEGERTSVRPGDILISITADVGMVGVVPENLGVAYINQHVGLCRPVSGDFTLYLAWYLASPDGQRRLRDPQRGATKLGLGLDDLRAVPVPFPPGHEQKRIIAAVDKMMSNCVAIENEVIRSLRRSGRLRHSILKRAFEGKLVPQDPNDEPASELVRRIAEEYGSDKTMNRRLVTMPKSVKTPKGRVPIIEVLRTSPSGLAPEDLLNLCGYGPESIDEFYAELKIEVIAGRVNERRTEEKAILEATRA